MTVAWVVAYFRRRLFMVWMIWLWEKEKERLELGTTLLLAAQQREGEKEREAGYSVDSQVCESPSSSKRVSQPRTLFSLVLTLKGYKRSRQTPHTHTVVCTPFDSIRLQQHKRLPPPPGRRRLLLLLLYSIALWYNAPYVFKGETHMAIVKCLAYSFIRWLMVGSGRDGAGRARDRLCLALRPTHFCLSFPLSIAHVVVVSSQSHTQFPSFFHHQHLSRMAQHTDRHARSKGKRGKTKWRPPCCCWLLCKTLATLRCAVQCRLQATLLSKYGRVGYDEELSKLAKK